MPGHSYAPADPDLYVAFGAAPTITTYACRPFVTAPNETCALDVAAGKAFVLVRGYDAGSYDLTVVAVGQ